MSCRDSPFDVHFHVHVPSLRYATGNTVMYIIVYIISILNHPEGNIIANEILFFSSLGPCIQLSVLDKLRSVRNCCHFHRSPHSGVKVMSVGSLLEESDSAVVWRGPRKTALIKRFLKDTFWGRLDYLIFDILYNVIVPTCSSMGTGAYV